MAQFRVKLTRDPIDIRSMRQPDAGAVVTFEGTVRAERSPQGRRLIALDYSAYEEMALEQFNALCQRAKTTFGVLDAVIVHRLGRAPVGEPSIVVIVAAAHRAEAFDACRWLMDTLKADAPIWKKEVWDDGSTTWSDPLRSEPTP